MFFISSDYAVPSNTVVTPECTTLEAVETVGAFVVTVSTFDTCSAKRFDGQHTWQTVDSEISRQVLHVATTGDSTLFSTFCACNDIMAATRS